MSLGLLLALPAAVVAQSASSLFSDVSDTHANASAIVYVQSTGIVSGYPDGTYKPDATINRAEFTKIITGAVYTTDEITACDTGTYTYDDVPSEQWFAPFVCIATQNDIVGGYGDGTFKPSNTINFAEASKIITLTMNVDQPSTSAEMPWYAGYIMGLEGKAAIPTDIASPSAVVTRGQMAEMVMRLRADIDTKPSATYASLTGETDSSFDIEADIELSTADSMDDILEFEEEMTDDAFDDLEDMMAELEAEIETTTVPEVNTEAAATEDTEITEDEVETTEDTTEATEAEETTEEAATETEEESTETTTDDETETTTEDTTAAAPAVYIDYTQEAFAGLVSSEKPFAVFYHADWCPSCNALDTEISAGLAQLPAGTAVLKFDYDTLAQDMRVEYGITAQHTAVFFDATGTYTETVPSFDFDDLITKLG